ncbi:flagellar hook-basal body complex protein [Tropicibacter oceani]|uniref:Flagellar basal-body rod protein FlgF n=1 Tax=Tropicibacter oceani TaxID=3058420 RepID=A0ABY8QLG4_9RHOB|nr:flagellar hook-basal body complex protein [Tropicibacter oceani]WGW04662.1 flagellar hook-basal body complex protein [Tropicibacter oceani]
MEATGYAALSRLSGLKREMQVIANNIANANTTGFRQQGIIFSEYVQDADGGASVAMSAARIRNTSFVQGTLEQTNGMFDMAIEGDGFFLIDAPNGQRLTRAGSFTPSNEGTLVTPDGYPVLGNGGAPVFVPPDATDLAIGRDGTISSKGVPLGQIGVVRPLEPTQMVREGSVLFRADAGFEPMEEPGVMQGFVEASNVNPILQISRMVEVQRAYELGQSFLDKEDERIRSAINAFIK